MDIMELLLAGGDPVQQQMIQAQALRSREKLNAALQKNRQDTSQYDLLNFAATAAGNNAPLAAATGGLQKSAQLRGRVQPLGQSGVIVGDELHENPEYNEVKSNERSNRMLQAAAMLDARRQQMQTKEDIFREAERGRMERHAENVALRQTLAGIAGGTRASAAAERQEAQKSRASEQALQRYSGKLTTEGIPEFEQALQQLEGVVNQYSDKDMPGIGRLDGFVPDMFASDEAQDVRSTIQKAANTLLKARSGAAVTDSEMRRFLTELAKGGGYDEQTFRKAIPRLREAWNAHTSGLAAGYAPEVHEEYVNRGGMDFRAKPKATPQGTPKPTPQALPAKPKRIKIDLNGNIIP